ncbi:hypothetical protein ABKN59_007498 [Abortiporus biennis]
MTRTKQSSQGSDNLNPTTNSIPPPATPKTDKKKKSPSPTTLYGGPDGFFKDVYRAKARLESAAALASEADSSSSFSSPSPETPPIHIPELPTQPDAYNTSPAGYVVATAIRNKLMVLLHDLETLQQKQEDLCSDLLDMKDLIEDDRAEITKSYDAACLLGDFGLRDAERFGSQIQEIQSVLRDRINHQIAFNPTISVTSEDSDPSSLKSKSKRNEKDKEVKNPFDPLPVRKQPWLGRLPITKIINFDHPSRPIQLNQIQPELPLQLQSTTSVTAESDKILNDPDLEMVQISVEDANVLETAVDEMLASAADALSDTDIISELVEEVNDLRKKVYLDESDRHASRVSSYLSAMGIQFETYRDQIPSLLVQAQGPQPDPRPEPVTTQDIPSIESESQSHTTTEPSIGSSSAIDDDAHFSLSPLTSPSPSPPPSTQKPKKAKDKGKTKAKEEVLGNTPKVKVSKRLSKEKGQVHDEEKNSKLKLRSDDETGRRRSARLSLSISPLTPSTSKFKTNPSTPKAKVETPLTVFSSEKKRTRSEYEADISEDDEFSDPDCKELVRKRVRITKTKETQRKEKNPKKTSRKSC